MKSKVELYNQTVRIRISEKLREAHDRKSDLIRERDEIYRKMHDKAVLHSDFLRLERRYNQIVRDIEDVTVEIRTWDAAREICLDVADELFSKKSTDGE